MSVTSKDLKKIYKATFNAKSKWRALSLELDLDITVIESISKKWQGNPDECLLEGLTEWLRTEQRTWEALVEALSSPTVGFPNLAKKIEKEFVSSVDRSIQGSASALDPRHQVITEDLIIYTEEKLGTGAFGVVFKGNYKGRPCAVKVLHHTALQMQTDLLAGQGSEEAVKTFKRECEFLESLRHPNIVDHISTEEHPKSRNTVLVVELLDCNLRSHLCSVTEESLSTACQISLSKDVASGLSYIHSKQIIHRDLCGDNVLVKVAEPIPTAKISDFGMSRLLDPTKLSSTLTAMGHRMGYLPPEASRLEEEQYDFSLDVFSLGVVMLQIVHKLETVKSPTERSSFVAQTPESHVLQPLIKECLQDDRKKRPPTKFICTKLGLFDSAEVDVHATFPVEGEEEKDPDDKATIDGPVECSDSVEPLKSRKGKDMPFKMGGAINSVVIGGAVYVGGGHTTSISDCERCTVMKYDIRKDEWTTLPEYTTQYFGMTSLNDKLLLVGGLCAGTRERSNKIGVFESEKWVHPYPPMSVVRDCPTAISYKNHIIVVGGWGLEGRFTDSLEVLDVVSKLWSITYLHEAYAMFSEMKSTVVKNTLYLMGGYDLTGRSNIVICINLDEAILDSLNHKGFFLQTTCMSPFKGFTPLAIGKNLLALGGYEDDRSKSDIQNYELDSLRNWWTLGHLIVPRQGCTCSVLTNGEIIVAGGWKDDNSGYTNSVEFLSVQEVKKRTSARLSLS